MSNFLLCIPPCLYCVLFLEEINSCLKEVVLAVISVFGPGMISRDGVQRKTKQQDRKKQMVFSKHCMDSVWNLICLSHCSVCVCVCPSGPRLKVIKTLLCWYINTCIYIVFLCVFALMKGGVFPPDPGPSHLCATKAGLLGGGQDRLLIRKLHAVETAGPEREEEGAVI